MENGEWGMGNGEWRMENGEWRIKNLLEKSFIKDVDIAENFGYKNVLSYCNSDAKRCIDKSLEWFYDLINKVIMDKVE